MSASALPSYAAISSLDDFVNDSVVIPVIKVSEHAANRQLRLSVAPSYPDKIDELEFASRSAMRSMGQAQASDSFMRKMLDVELKGDLWYTVTDVGAAIVLVQQGAYSRLGESMIKRSVHRDLVTACYQRGDVIDPELLRQYNLSAAHQPPSIN